MTMSKEDPLNLANAIGAFVAQHQLRVESLTQIQLAEAIRQALMSGDFMRHVVVDGRQGVTYIPYREIDTIRSQYQELLYAVASKFPDESRHDTALRYIREREAGTGDAAKAGEDA